MTRRHISYKVDYSNNVISCEHYKTAPKINVSANMESYFPWVCQNSRKLLQFICFKRDFNLRISYLWITDSSIMLPLNAVPVMSVFTRFDYKLICFHHGTDGRSLTMMTEYCFLWHSRNSQRVAVGLFWKHFCNLFTNYFAVSISTVSVLGVKRKSPTSLPRTIHLELPHGHQGAPQGVGLRSFNNSWGLVRVTLTYY